MRNSNLLGIEPERLNGLIPRHGHRNHYGGLGFVAQYRERISEDLQLFVGREEPFAKMGRLAR